MERTVEEYETLLDRSGLRLSNVWVTPSSYGIIETVARRSISYSTTLEGILRKLSIVSAVRVAFSD